MSTLPAEGTPEPAMTAKERYWAEYWAEVERRAVRIHLTDEQIKRINEIISS